MRKKILIGSVVIILGIILWLTVTWIKFLDAPLIPANSKSLTYILKPGATITSFAHDLNAQNILSKPNYFVTLAYVRGATKKLQAGEYIFQPGITPAQLLNQVVKGQVVQHRFTIVEGWTFKQLLSALNKAPDIKHTSDTEKIISSLGLPAQNPEGLFFPATYAYNYGTTDISLLKQAYQKMNKQLDKAWRERAAGLPYKTAYEALIAASLVEKETAKPNERALIAGVIKQRLQQNMLLQIDSTVIYGLGDNYNGKLTIANLQRDTLYNTYTRHGLPPTPIAMPSLASLIAVLHPDNSGYLYFVAKGDGTHQFSKSLQQQNQAVNIYQINVMYPTFAKKNPNLLCVSPWYLNGDLKKLFTIQCRLKT